MKPKIEINATNFFSSLQSKLYTSATTVLDELVQNSQRAGATRIDIDLHPERLVITDNGDGCKDPQKFLTVSESGWEEDVVNSDDPFGMGFWSVALLGGLVFVRSRDWEMKIDVDKMLEKKTLDVVGIDRHVEPRDKGTEISVFGEYDREEFADHLEGLVRFMDVDVYLDGEPLDTRNDYKDPSSISTFDPDYFVEIDLPGMTGHLRAAQYCFNDTMAYFQGRPVRGIKELEYIKGCIHFDSTRMDPRAPDRKDIVENEKWAATVQALKAEAQKMYLKVVLEDEMVDKYDRAIAHHLDLDDLLKHIRFSLLSEGDADMALEIAKRLKDNGQTDCASDWEITKVEREIEKELQKQEDESDERSDTKAADPSPDDEDDGQEDHDPAREARINKFRSPSPEADGPEALDDMEVKAPTFQKGWSERVRKSKGMLASEVGLVFWVRKGEMPRYEDELGLAAYHDVPLVVCGNGVQSMIASEMDNFHHIGVFSQKMRLKTKFSKRESSSKKEERAQYLLHRLGKAFGVDRVEICDIDAVRVIEGYGEIGESHPLAIAQVNDEGVKTIWVQRRHYKKIAKQTRFRSRKEPRDERVSKPDSRFLLGMAGVMAHEMAHLLSGTSDGSIEHEKSTLHWYDEIVAAAMEYL